MKKRATIAGLRRQMRELQFAQLWERLKHAKAHPFVTEHRFDADRQWRFDFAWPSVRVAVEIEGGTFARKKSRHTTSSGHQADCEKYNAAAVAGWCVLRFTSKDLDARPVQVCDQIASAIRDRSRA